MSNQASKQSSQSAHRSSLSRWFKSGDPWIWLNAGAVSVSLITVFGLLILIAARGLGHFWPADVLAIDYKTDQGTITIIGEKRDIESIPKNQYQEATGVAPPQALTAVERWLMKTGNRDALGSDFRWLDAFNIQNVKKPADLVALERTEWGHFFGYLNEFKQSDGQVFTGDAAYQQLLKRVALTNELRDQAKTIETSDIGSINYQLEDLRLDRRKLELNQESLTPEQILRIENDIQAEEKRLDIEYEVLRVQLDNLYQTINQEMATFTIMDGRSIDVNLATIIDVYQPNAMGVWQKLKFYFVNLGKFVSGEPREANTEGGIFPAIFGTVMMVLVMSFLVTPFGVVAAVYLREYAKQGLLIRTIRIAVNNLAGVPSIVYGVFGLGFFVYFLGGNLDKLFYPEALPAPTFGTPGLMWASLTLALLTVPVVIVSTEEGLSRIPKAIREGSLALGATQAETLWKVVLPMASPSIMTGVILAIARAAGEVAPLMLVGVVKLAPQLPLDGNFPYLHLERKFMHLGFHIYDVGFQSPNVEAARPLVYATALLLVLVIIALNLSAIMIRNRLREKYRALS